MHPSLLPAPTTGASTDPLDAGLLSEIAAGLALAVAHDTAATSDRRLLLRTSRYEAWLLAWPTGVVWECDGRDPGVLHVVRGELVEHWKHLLHLDHDQRIVRAGDVVALGGSFATRVENRGTDAAHVVHVTSLSAHVAPCRDELRLVS